MAGGESDVLMMTISLVMVGTLLISPSLASSFFCAREHQERIVL